MAQVFCLDRECLEQKIINKNMEIVRLQEKLMVHAKLERDLKDIACKNEKLTTQLKAMSGFEIEVKKKASIIRSLEEKLKNTEVLEVEIESQAHVIQHLQAAVNEGVCFWLNCKTVQANQLALCLIENRRDGNGDS